MMLRSVVSIVIWNVAVCLHAAEFRGQVRLNELEGPAMENVAVSADGANPKVTDSDGRFDLVFDNKRRGDRVELNVKKEGYVVVHSIMLQYVLLSDPTSVREKILLAKPGDREEMALRYFRLKSVEVAERSYRQGIAQPGRAWGAADLLQRPKGLEHAKALAEKVGEQLAREDMGRGSELYQQALRLFLDGKVDAALDVLDEAKLRKKREDAKRAARDVSQEFQLRGQLLTLKFRFADATRAYHSAVEAAPGEFAAHFALALFSQDLNRQKEALASYSRALELARESGGAPYVATILVNLGNVYCAENRMAEARAAYEEALKTYQRLAEKDPDTYMFYVAGTLCNLGALNFCENRPVEARTVFEEALKTYQELAERNPAAYAPALAHALDCMGTLDRNENRISEARTDYEQAISIQRQLAERNPGAYAPALARILGCVGNLDRDERRVAEARMAYEETLAIRRQFAETNPDTYLPLVAMTLNNLGVLHHRANRMVEARAAYEEALAIRRQFAEANPDTYLPFVAMTLNNLGVLHSDENRMAEARTSHEEALKTYRQLAEKNPDKYLPDVAATLSNLGILYRDEKQPKEAHAAFEEALKIFREFAKKSPNRFYRDVQLVEKLIKTVKE